MSEHPEPNDGEHEAGEGKKRAEVHTDEAKDRHTSHWDMDYLSTDEIETAYREGREHQQEQEQEQEEGEAKAKEDDSSNG